MRRREFLLTAAVIPRALQSLTSEGWRLFDVTTHVHVQNASGTTRVWLPTPLVGAPYQQTLGDTYNAEHGRVVMVESDELDLLLGEWTDGADPVLDLTSRVATRPYAVDLTRPIVEPPADFATFARFLRATKLHPVDGAVKMLATDVTRRAGTDIDRARALFDWLGRAGAAACGLPEAQCADPSTLFVAMARSLGIPARVLFGLRLSADATKAQQTRAEVYLVGFGWVPVDLRPSQRPPSLWRPPSLPGGTEVSRGTEVVQGFGSWAGDWIAFNIAQDVPLPKTKRGTLPFFMRPQAETANGFANSLDPATFRYEISVRETA